MNESSDIRCSPISQLCENHGPIWPFSGHYQMRIFLPVLYMCIALIKVHSTPVLCCILNPPQKMTTDLIGF